LSGRCCQKKLFLKKKKLTTQSQPNYVSVFIHPTFTGPLSSLFFVSFGINTPSPKIKGWVQIVGANIGSFDKSLCPYPWDIYMVVWTKQFVLYSVHG
jgi:hypothetical protein